MQDSHLAAPRDDQFGQIVQHIIPIRLVGFDRLDVSAGHIQSTGKAGVCFQQQQIHASLGSFASHLGNDDRSLLTGLGVTQTLDVFG